MKRFLMILGGLFVMMIGAIGLLAVQAVSVAGQNQEAAVAAVRSISKDWSLVKSQQHVAPALMRISDAPKVQRAFRYFERFGALVKAEDASQTNYSMSTETGTTAVVQFVGTFQNGKAKVTVKLHENNGRMRVYGLHLKPLTPPTPDRQYNA
jgi:hypothetical protein